MPKCCVYPLIDHERFTIDVAMLKRILPVSSFTLVSLFLLLSCSVYQPGFEIQTSTEKVYLPDSITTDITFTPDDWPMPLAGDLYLPKRGDVMPVVVTIHGGGWSSRSRSDMNSIAEKLVQRGYAVFNISYRFAPKFTYPAQLQDVQQALSWIVNNAKRYHFDLDRINTWGYSSGAHLAALVAGFRSSEGYLPAIRSVVAGGIPADLSQYSGSPIIIPFIGGNRHEKPDVYRQASPISHVSSDHPPAFLYHGQLDTLVEPEQSINYHKALEAEGIESELYLHRVWGHFAMFLFGWDAENRAIEFLDYHNA